MHAALHLTPIGATGERITLKFDGLDDFHPDRLLKVISPLAELMVVRKELDSSRAAAAAEKLHAILKLAAPTTQQLAEPPAPLAAETKRNVPAESTEETLGRLLGKQPLEVPAQVVKSAEALDATSIVQRILGSSVTPTPPPPVGLPGLIAAAERELSERLRALLSHPDFQAVEAAWRGLDFLIRRCPDEDRISYFALDATQEELAADLPGLHRMLRDSSWGGLIGGFQFGKTSSNLAVLGGIGALCRALGTSFLAGGVPQLLGCDNFYQHPDPDDWNQLPAPDVVQAWSELRRSDEAAYVGLALPRFLLRQPYGKAGDPIEGFNFEEITDGSDHERFLWGNSALLCAHLIAEGHVTGERIAAGNVSDLQLAQFTERGGLALKPCAEAWLVDRAAEAIARQGLIAVQSFKGKDAAQVTGIHAICHPEKASRVFS